VDSFAPQARNAGSATTIRSIATVREFSPLLKDAFNAVSTTFAGQCMDDRQIVIAGHGVYTAVLKSLQEALAHPVYRSVHLLQCTIFTQPLQQRGSCFFQRACMRPSYLEIPIRDG
jgi:hypothetical protein